MAANDVSAKYAWVGGIEAWTVAVMSRRSLDDVVRIYGRGKDEPIGEVAFVDADDHRGPDLDRLYPMVHVLTLDEHTVTLEHNGWSGAFPEIARRCGDGWFFSVYWNLNGAGSVTQVIDGEVTARFDSLYPLAMDEQPGERRPGWAIGPEVEPGLAWQTCMAQLEEQTGVVVDPAWLRLPLPTFRIPEPYGLYRSVAGAELI